MSTKSLRTVGASTLEQEQSTRHAQPVFGQAAVGLSCEPGWEVAEVRSLPSGRGDVCKDLRCTSSFALSHPFAFCLLRNHPALGPFASL
eukprot:576522-Prymnesium_polylepis.1